MTTPSRAWALAASLLLAGSLAACGSPDAGNGGATPADGGTGGQTDAGGNGETTPAGDVVTVGTAETDLGTILVDGDGMTLYLFTNDSPGVSVCEDACLAAWPALLGEPEAGEGTDEALLGTLERSDGTTQVSYNGWPLYYWAQDSAPGDTTGQGVNDVWWVVSPAGEPIGATS